jgi:heptosyltransferase-2
MGTRILVIKLAAAGDVLRATAVLPPLRRKYPESHITWVADEPALPLVAGNPFIDRAMAFGFDTWLVLSSSSFDVAISLDKEPRAGAFLTSMTAKTRLGFGLTEWGTTEPLNEGAWYDLELGLSNERKFHGNSETYSAIVCRAAEVEYEGEPYTLALPDSSIEYARRFLAGLGAPEPLVGLNMGAGGVFANKAWPAEAFGRLARAVSERLGGTALVLGGPADRTRADQVLTLAPGAVRDGGTHALLDFAAIVGALDALVTGDTMAMHIAIALGVPVVALFGPTVPQEIEFYGPGRKLVTPAECAPCYRRQCGRSPTCMDAITVDEVVRALEEVLEERS